MAKRWLDKDVWIIGGGMSMSEEFDIPDSIVKSVLEGKEKPSIYSKYLLPIQSKIVIGINAAYLIGNWMDVIFFGDDKIWNEHKKGLLAYPGILVSCNKMFEKVPNLKVSYIKMDKNNKYGISDNPNIVRWNDNSGAAAINLAINQGAKRIFLLGFDMNADKGTHWHNEYIQKKIPFKRHLIGYPQIAEDAKRMGVEIINLSQNSSIDCFKKDTVKNVLKIKKSNTKVGVVIPTCSEERKQFLKFTEKRISEQTRTPDVILKIDYPNKTGKSDISKRYKEGFKQLFEQGCDLVFLIEDDDYYPKTYIEEMLFYWENNNKPAMIGCSETIYYHIMNKGFRKMITTARASAFCTAVSRKVKYNIPNKTPFFDISLWKLNSGDLVKLKNKPIGIKHGLGLSGGNGHKAKMYKEFDDVNQTKLRSWIDDEAFELYTNIVNDVLYTEPEALSKKEWSDMYIKLDMVKPKIKVGAIYSTFYDLDMIEDSLLSIKAVVDYIVIVHQRIGFNNEEQPNFNPEILKRLDKIPNVKIIYFEGGDYKNGMLNKLNIGLDYIKEKECDYVISISPDEQYDGRDILSEIEYMFKNNVDTLYLPIKAYYYDKMHYFIDTYFTQSIHKVDERKYERGFSTYLCDPQKKMKEKNYRLSKYFCHHYTFLKNTYGNKLHKSIRASVPVFAKQMKQIQEHLINWKEGQTALVFSNDLEGNVILTDKELLKVKQKKILTYFRNNRIEIFIMTYKRPQWCLNLLMDIKKQGRNYDYTVRVIHDGDSLDYSIVKNFCRNNFNFDFRQTPKHYGKDGFWELNNNIYRFAETLSYDYFIQMPDDIVLVDNFFKRVTWLLNEKVLLCNFATVNAHKEGFKNLPIKKIKGVEYWANDWVDCCFITKKEVIDDVRLEQTVVKKKNRGSGVAHKFIKCINEKGIKIYQTRYALFEHIGAFKTTMHSKNRNKELWNEKNENIKNYKKNMDRKILCNLLNTDKDYIEKKIKKMIKQKLI